MVNVQFLLQLQPEWQRTQQSTRNRGKAIVTSSAPTYDPEPATKSGEFSVKTGKEYGHVQGNVRNQSKKEMSSIIMYIAQNSRGYSPVSVDTSGPIFDDEPMHKKQKCEFDDAAKRNKFLESSNKELVDKLKGEIEDFKTKNKSLESSNNHFKEANNELSKTNQLMFKDLKKFQAELDKYKDVNYASKWKLIVQKLKWN
ncbi:hypothetical protein Tco_0595303 [Tanacetum coccineum]